VVAGVSSLVVVRYNFNYGRSYFDRENAIAIYKPETASRERSCTQLLSTGRSQAPEEIAPFELARFFTIGAICVLIGAIVDFAPIKRG
jgi:hypothetical protein